MTDKEKIREEVERLMNELIQEKKKGFGSDADDACILELQNVLTYIDSLQEEPVSEELEEAAKKHAKCQREDDLECGYELTKLESFIAGAKWKEEQFEKNRLKHCNSITNEQAELEQGFIDQHLAKYDRMPTFLDAIEYGMRLQKEQMMEQAIDGEIGYWNLHGLSVNVKLPHSVEEGDKAKVIVIKED